MWEGRSASASPDQACQNGKGEKAVHDTVWKTAVFSVYQANEAYKVIYSFGLSEKEINGIKLSTLQMEIKAKKGW
jgi:hypothetical protein